MTSFKKMVSEQQGKVLALMSIVTFSSWCVFIEHSLRNRHHTGKGGYGSYYDIRVSTLFSALTLLNCLILLALLKLPRWSIIRFLCVITTWANLLVSIVFILFVVLIGLAVGGGELPKNLLDYLMYLPLLINFYVFYISYKNKDL